MRFFSNKPYAFTSTLLVLFAAIVPTASGDPVDWVNLYIGTGSGPIGYGRTMPFVTPPFGMTSWTPQTRQNQQPGLSYKYQDNTISGFIGTHQPAGQERKVVAHDHGAAVSLFRRCTVDAD